MRWTRALLVIAALSACKRGGDDRGASTPPRDAAAAAARPDAAAKPEAGGGGGDSAGGGGAGRDVDDRPAPSADLTIAIEGPAGPSTFTGDKLAALPTITAPVGDTETPGWSLTDVLAAAGIGEGQVFHLTDEQGATLRLEGEDFDPTKTVLYLKLNRSGVLRFRLYRKQGSSWKVGGELRGISRIKVIE